MHARLILRKLMFSSAVLTNVAFFVGCVLSCYAALSWRESRWLYVAPLLLGTLLWLVISLAQGVFPNDFLTPVVFAVVYYVIGWSAATIAQVRRDSARKRK